MERQFTLSQRVSTADMQQEFKADVWVNVITKRDTYYKYIEALDDHKLEVVMRVRPNDIKIQRRGIINMNIHFIKGVLTDTFYESPAGRHHFKVYTTFLTFEPNITIHYDLYEHNEKIGTYEYTLKESENDGH